MPNFTTNYNLIKPIGTELYDVEDNNGNADKIDAAIKVSEETTDVHINNVANPHAVTKTQVGLPNVDNTSDANKPVSTAQQTALNLKIDTTKIANNLTENVPGKVLDATQGKLLDDKILTNVIRSARLSDSIIDLTETTKSILPDVTVSTYEKVSTLSDKAKEGQMNVKVSGNTAKDEIINGNFANGTTGWDGVGATSSVVDGVLNSLATGTAGSVIKTNLTLTSGRKKYIRANVKADSNQVRLELYDNSTPFQVFGFSAHSGSFNYEILSTIAIISNDTIGGRFGIRDRRTSLWTTVYSDDFMIIDMGSDTSNPLYNLTAAEMDTRFPDYFDGLASTVAGSLKTVGKNLFDGKLLQGYPSLELSPNGLSTLNSISVIPSNNYIVAWYCTKLSNIYLTTYDNQKRLIRSNINIGSNSSPRGFSTSPGEHYVKLNIYFPSGVSASDIISTQLEIGSTATAYEPYTETLRPLGNYTLRSLPNGVKDTIDMNRHVKNVEEYTLQSADISSVYTAPNNVDVVYFSKRANDKNVNNEINLTTLLNVIYNPYILGTYSDNIIAIGRIINGTSTHYGLIVANGAYANLAAAQTALAGTKILYQLATPIITELLPSPLKSSPKGQVIYLNQRTEISRYLTNATVTNTSAPIKSMIRLWKIMPDGTRIPLSVVTGITIAVGGLSFTHTSLTSGDNIEWEYEFDSALTTTGLIDYSYNNNGIPLPAITVPTFTNSWVVNILAGYYIDSHSVVNLVGEIKTGTSGQSAFTLAVGFRPLHQLRFAVVSNGVFGYVTINTDGTVVPTANNTYVSLQGISFRIDM